MIRLAPFADAVRSHPAIASTAIYVAVTAIVGRRVLGSLGSAIASDPGDPILNAAILAWNAMHVPWTDAWFQFPIFHPTANALTLSEHLLGVSLVASPIYWLTGNPLIAYNLTLLLSYPLSGMAMYALVRRLTGSAAAAFLAGLAFAFTPYRASQLPHIQVLIVWWAPLALLGLHGFLEARRRPAALWLALFAVAWVLQGASNGYFLVFFSVLVGLWVLWFLVARRRWRETALVGAAAAVAFLPLAPIIFRYLSSHRELGLSRNLGEIDSFAADIAAPLCAPSTLTFWSWLRVACAPEGDLFAGAALIALCLAGAWYAGAREPRTQEDDGAPSSGGWPGVRILRRVALGVATVYMGIAVSVVAFGPWRIDWGWMRASASSPDKPLSTAAALLLVALLLSSWFRQTVRRGSTATFYLGAAIVCWVLSWGPFPSLLGADALYQAPYAWLMQLPGVDNLRAPARFWMMTVLCLVIFMGIVVARLLHGRSRRASALLVGVAAGALLMDGWLTIPIAPALAPPDAESLRGRVVLELPAGDVGRDIAAVYLAVSGGWRTVNGYSGYEPGYYEALRTLSANGDAVLFEPFAADGPLHVLVEENDRDAQALVERQPGAAAAGHARGRLRYTLPRRELRAPEPPQLGERVQIRGLDATCSPEGVTFVADGDLDTSWVCGSQVSDQQLGVDVGSIGQVGAVAWALGTRGADFPRHLVIDTSTDLVTWQPAWTGSPAAAVLRAAIEAPRVTRVVTRFAPRQARYVRLRQTGRHEINYWSIAELEVWSGAPDAPTW